MGNETQVNAASVKREPVNKNLSREIYLGAEKSSLLEACAQTGSLNASCAMLATNVVKGLDEHHFGHSIIPVKYQMTEAGMAVEFKQNGVTHRILLKDLLNPQADRLADNPNYKQLAPEVISALLEIERAFKENPKVSQAVFCSFGHGKMQESDESWIYLFSRNPANPNEILMTAVRHPGSVSQVEQFVAQLINSRALDSSKPHFINQDRPQIVMGNLFDAIVNSLDGGDPRFSRYLNNLRAQTSDFEQYRLERELEINALTRQLIQKVNEHWFLDEEQKVDLLISEAERYIASLIDPEYAKQAKINSNPRKPGGAPDGGLGQEIAETEQDLNELILERLEAGSIAELLEDLAANDDQLELSSGPEILAIEEDSYEAQEVDSGDDGYEGVATETSLDNDLDEDEETDEDDDDEVSTLTLQLIEEEEQEEGEDLEDGAEDQELLLAEEGEEMEEDAGEVETLSFVEESEQEKSETELAEEQTAEEQLTSISDDAGEAALDILQLNSSEPADLAEILEALSAMESAAEISAEELDILNDNLALFEEPSQNPSLLSMFDEESSDSHSLIAAADDQAEAVQELAEALAMVGEEAESIGTDTEEDLASDASTGFFFASDTEANRTIELKERRVRLVKKLAAMRDLADARGIDVFALMRERQRLVRNELWLEQLLYALARELKLSVSERSSLFEELKISADEMFDIRNLELAVKQKLREEKRLKRVVEPLEVIDIQPRHTNLAFKTLIKSNG